jgi:hypothetical protein
MTKNRTDKERGAMFRHLNPSKLNPLRHKEPAAPLSRGPRANATDAEGAVRKALADADLKVVRVGTKQGQSGSFLRITVEGPKLPRDEKGSINIDSPEYAAHQELRRRAVEAVVKLRPGKDPISAEDAKSQVMVEVSEPKTKEPKAVGALAAALLPFLVLLLMAAPSDAVAMRAPTFTFTGVYIVALDAPVPSAVLVLDTGQTATGTGTTVTLYQVPDGLHRFRLNVTTATGAQSFVGEFTSQDLSPLIARQVQVAVDASRASQQAALEAEAAAVEAHNATLQVQAAVQEAVLAINAIPPELQRQEEAQRDAFFALAQGQEALGIGMAQVAANQTHALQEAQKTVTDLRNVQVAMVALLATGMALLAIYVHGLRRDSLGVEDRALLRAVAAHVQVPAEDVERELRELGCKPTRRRPPRPRRPEPTPPPALPEPPVVEPPNLDALLAQHLMSQGGDADGRHP